MFGGLTPNHVRMYQRVADAYAGKSVLITGASGFLGKIIMESLLYNCKNIGNIYVLLRQKNGVSVEQRLMNMMNVPLFDRIKKSRPEDLKKVVAIGGDLLMPELAIKSTDKRELENNVSIVFHSAANVKLNDSFINTFNTNYGGTKKIMDLGKKMKKLETFVHVSTAFCNYDKDFVDEVFYPYPMTVEKLQQLLAKYGEDRRDIQKHIIAMRRSNFYGFSKRLTENLVEEERGHMPTIIVRPAIVSAISRDPVPGWMDTWVTGSAMFNDAYQGFSKFGIGHDDVICNLVPADYVCNLTIVAGGRGNKTKDLLIYNICTSSVNPVTWKYCFDQFLSMRPKDTDIKNKWIMQPEWKVKLLSPLKEILPAYLCDVRLRIKGREPRYAESVKRALVMREMMTPVTTNSVVFNSTRSQALAASLDREDQRRFPCDVRNIVWSEYMGVFQNGLHKFMLNKK